MKTTFLLPVKNTIEENPHTFPDSTAIPKYLNKMIESLSKAYICYVYI